MVGHHFVAKNSRVWHPNTQMSEWGGFDKITNAKGMYLYDSRGRKYIDGVASMWIIVKAHILIKYGYMKNTLWISQYWRFF